MTNEETNAALAFLNPKTRGRYFAFNPEMRRKIAAVIAAEAVRLNPRVWEIMRDYSADEECAVGDCVARMNEIVEAYGETNTNGGTNQ